MRKTDDERIDRCPRCGDWRWDKYCNTCQTTIDNNRLGGC